MKEKNKKTKHIFIFYRFNDGIDIQKMKASR